ncbi:MAG: glycosyltransferase [Candidatus Omnitrophota bacterium]|jgi:hypothetical protein
MAKVGVVTNRWGISHLVMHGVYDFEDCLVRAMGAELIYIPPRKQDLINKCKRKIKLGGIRLKDSYDVLVCVSLDLNTVLTDILNWRDRCKYCICYMHDTWPNLASNYQQSIKNVLRKVDLLCFSLYDSIPYFKTLLNPLPYWVPQAINPDRFYYVPGLNREIPIYLFGRQPNGVFEKVRSYCLNNNLFMAHHYKLRFPGETVLDWDSGHTLHAQLLLHSKVTLNWGMHLTHPCRLISPVTSRWFETSATGCLVVGQEPKGEEFKKFFPVSGFVRNVNKNLDNLIPLIEEAIYDKGSEDIRRQVAEYTKNHHTWYHRIAQILTKAKLTHLLKPEYRKYLKQ